MDEAQIARQVAQKLTPPPNTVLTQPEAPAPVDTSYGQATTAPAFELDEMTQYKLHDYFGEVYRDSDEVKRQQVQSIYRQVSELIDSQDYGFVVAKIRDIERIIGLNGASNRLYRLYQWLRLDQARRSLDAEQGALTDV